MRNSERRRQLRSWAIDRSVRRRTAVRFHIWSKVGGALAAAVPTFDQM